MCRSWGSPLVLAPVALTLSGTERGAKARLRAGRPTLEGEWTAPALAAHARCAPAGQTAALDCCARACLVVRPSARCDSDETVRVCCCGR
ncbi:hypothetical protein MTO96_011837 [Rhipicephalus appendiculatus]